MVIIFLCIRCNIQCQKRNEYNKDSNLKNKRVELTEKEIKIKLLSKQAKEVTASYSLVRKKNWGGGSWAVLFSNYKENKDLLIVNHGTWLKVKKEEKHF